MQQYFGLRGKALSNALVWAVIMPAYLLFGYDNGVAGGLLDLPAWVELFPEIDTVNTTGAQKKHNSHIQGTVVAVYTLGALFGALSCALIGDWLGRRRTIMLGTVVTSIGSILQCSTFSFAQLIIGRFITGLGLGAISATAPNWQVEVSYLNALTEIVLQGKPSAVEPAIEAWINFGFSHTTGGLSWRFSLAFSLFFTIIVFFSVPLWPESPRWLVKVGRIEEARHVLAALDDVSIDSPVIAQELREIEISLEETGKGTFRDIFRNGPARFANRAFIAAITQCFQQMSGINVLGYYQTTIFRTLLGLDSSTARILSATVFMWQALCTLIGAFTIERVGRRKLMIFGAAGMGLCMALIAGCTSHPSNHTAGFLGLAFLYSSEIAPLSVRTPITAFSTTSTWLFTFTVVEATPTGFNSLGFKYFIIYAANKLAPHTAECLSYWFFPETQGLHLESVDRIFIESKNIFDPVRVAKRLRANAVVGKDGDIQIEGEEKEKSLDEQTEEVP
ncbi:putative MFS sugar transporter [Mycena olivaceomarginata]|nr:putative MFS sugar transporter [Mycena olivaceomarginata]